MCTFFPRLNTSNMPANVDILTGYVIGELENGVTPIPHTHSLWISAADAHILSKCPFLDTLEIYLRDDSRALPFKLWGSNETKRFHNIAHFSHSWHIFNYYLYHRQFSEKNAPYAFEDQVSLHLRANKYGYTQNYWITHQFLWFNLRGKYWLTSPGHSVRVCCPLKPSMGNEWVYNTQKTNDPCVVRRRICVTSRNCVFDRSALTHVRESLYQTAKERGLKPSQCVTGILRLSSKGNCHKLRALA